MTRILLFLSLLVSLNASAQDGSVDTSFGNNGFAITDFLGSWDQASMVAVQEDGKIVVFGFVHLPGGGFAEGLLRYLPDGSLDTTFGTDGLVTTIAGDYYEEYFNSLHIQPDQKIITSTTFLENEEADFTMVRYLPNGQMDYSFGIDGRVRTNVGNDYLAATVLLPDGKIIAGGRAIKNDTENNILLVQYLSDGSLDPSFGSAGILEEYINDATLKVFDVKVQEDGKIIVPYFTVKNFVRKFKVARYLPNGTLDVSFGEDGIVASDISWDLGYVATVIQRDGKILHSYKGGPGSDNFYIIRMLSNGTPDASFGAEGIVEIYNPLFLALKLLQQEDDKILVFGMTRGFEPDNNLTYRFNLDGSIDPSFGSNGEVYLGFEGADIALQENEKILITGNTFFYSGPVDFVVARLNNGLLEVPNYKKPPLTVYPNPSNGIFTVESQLLSETADFQITDITGKIIVSGELSNQQTQIDFSLVQSGVYFLKTSEGVFRLLKN